MDRAALLCESEETVDKAPRRRPGPHGGIENTRGWAKAPLHVQTLQKWELFQKFPFFLRSSGRHFAARLRVCRKSQSLSQGRIASARPVAFRHEAAVKQPPRFLLRHAPGSPRVGESWHAAPERARREWVRHWFRRGVTVREETVPLASGEASPASFFTAHVL